MLIRGVYVCRACTPLIWPQAIFSAVKNANSFVGGFDSVKISEILCIP